MRESPSTHQSQRAVMVTHILEVPQHEFHCLDRNRTKALMACRSAKKLAEAAQERGIEANALLAEARVHLLPFPASYLAKKRPDKEDLKLATTTLAEARQLYESMDDLKGLADVAEALRVADTGISHRSGKPWLACFGVFRPAPGGSRRALASAERSHTSPTETCTPGSSRCRCRSARKPCRLGTSSNRS